MNRAVNDGDPKQVMFTDAELNYLSTQVLGRVATATTSGHPHVVPVAYEFDGRYLYFCGWNLERSRKFRMIGENSRVAFVVDDLASARPWRPRGIEIEGEAQILRARGTPYVRITPVTKRSWGL